MCIPDPAVAQEGPGPVGRTVLPWPVAGYDPRLRAFSAPCAFSGQTLEFWLLYTDDAFPTPAIVTEKI